MNITEIIVGGPGSGKTGELLRLLEIELARGIAPERIAFLAFTNAAADEARARTREKFNLDNKQLKWFRTLHSVAFELLGLRREDVLTKRHWAELGDALGLTFRLGADALDGPLLSTDQEGDRLRALYQLSHAKGHDLKLLWQELGAGVAFERVEQFESALARFKLDLGLVDFSDMLELFIERGLTLDVEVAFIDEAQDLTTAQWRTLEVALAGVARIYVAGDDDQAIYEWAGADVTKFRYLEKSWRVLPRSYRLPATVFEVARRIVEPIEGRYPKEWAPREANGLVAAVADLTDVDLSQAGTWLLLGRHRYQLSELARVAREAGVPYTVSGRPAVDPDIVTAIRAWETLRNGREIELEYARLIDGYLGGPLTLPQESDPIRISPSAARALGWPLAKLWHDTLLGIDIEEREFYRACLRRGEDLIALPRVRVSTIHGAKGTEADRVLVLSDLSARAWRGLKVNEAAERRVAYVAATRAREALYVAYPRTALYFPWPLA